ncbi:hypothetical protein AB0L75_40650 [Streptomyces sp. NPDC052101]|uniref:hypothetical protein n=1 Tax=Streptomyces sp. NPDC052101 TaxID=3155763 RepID=UPI00343E426C
MTDSGLGVVGAAVLIGAVRTVFGFAFDTTATLLAFTAITSTAAAVGELTRCSTTPERLRRAHASQMGFHCGPGGGRRRRRPER